MVFVLDYEMPVFPSWTRLSGLIDLIYRPVVLTRFSCCQVGNPLSNPELAAAILGWDAASKKEIQKDNLPLSVAVISDSSWDQEGAQRKLLVSS